MITVFFDGKCGLCSREIRHYQKIAPPGHFCWSDIASDPTPLEAIGISQAAALERLHVQSADGELHIGVDAFLVIWAALPRWRLLGKVVSLPGCYKMTGKLYDRFAKKRFERLDHCQAASASD